MCAVLVGRLKWVKEVNFTGSAMGDWQLTLLSGEEPFAMEVVEKSDAVVIFTDHATLDARQKVLQAASKRRVPVIMRHSCGVNLLQNCFERLDAK